MQIASSARSIVGSIVRGGGKSPRCTAQDRPDVSAFERGLAGQETVKGGSEAVDIGARAEPVELAAGLLGAHVGRGPHRRPGQGVGTAAGRARHQHSLLEVAPRLDPAQRLCQAPVDDQRLAVLAEDDVGRLDVPVKHASAVRVLDRVADVGESPQEPAQLERPLARATLPCLLAVEQLDGLLEALALDEPHGVVGAACAVHAQPVDRDDPGVFESTGDLGLDQEPLATGRVVGVVVEDLLECHLAIELGVQRHEDRPQPAAGMRPEHAEPLAVAGGCADGNAAGAVGIVVLGAGRAMFGGDLVERRLDVGVADPGQARLRRLAGRDRGQAFSHVAAVALEVARHHRLDRRAVVRVQVAACLQVVGQAPGLFECPGLEGGHELTLVDQAVLQCEHSEKEMAVGGSGHVGVPSDNAVAGTPSHGTSPRQDVEANVASDVLSQERTGPSNPYRTGIVMTCHSQRSPRMTHREAITARPTPVARQSGGGSDDAAGLATELVHRPNKPAGVYTSVYASQVLSALAPHHKHNRAGRGEQEPTDPKPPNATNPEKRGERGQIGPKSAILIILSRDSPAGHRSVRSHGTSPEGPDESGPNRDAGRFSCLRRAHWSRTCPTAFARARP